MNTTLPETTSQNIYTTKVLCKKISVLNNKNSHDRGAKMMQRSPHPLSDWVRARGGGRP